MSSITRIVKMQFQEDKADDFAIFTKEIYTKIRAFDGCLHLEIHRDINTPTLFFSYSKWISEDHLNRYRQSDFFRKTWSITKQGFADKPQAWSVSDLAPIS